MQIQNPTSGRIIKRYKRFLADVFIQDDAELKTIYVPNTGSMQSCWDENWPIIASFKDDPKRKYQYTLELLNNGETWIGVNTGNTNNLVEDALKNKVITELAHYKNIKREVSIGDSRIDFLLESECYVEVKNVTLREENYALFPDSVSTRGQKHLNELIEIVESGHKAALLFVVQREDVEFVDANNLIDPVYSTLLAQAKQAGVQILAYQCSLTEEEVKIDRPIEVRFS